MPEGMSEYHPESQDTQNSETVLTPEQAKNSPFKQILCKLKPTFNYAHSESRRKVIKRGMLVAGTLAVGVPLAKYGVDAIQSNLEESNESVEERFKENGVSDLLSFYKTVSNLSDTYRAVPSYTFDDLDPYVSDPYQLLNRIAGGESLDPILLTRIRDQWGEKFNHAETTAVTKAETMKITVADGLHDKVEDIRGREKRVARLSPGHIMMAPDELHIVYETTDGKTLTAGNYQGEGDHPYIDVASTEYGEKNYYPDLLHELSHGEINWIDGKPFARSQKLWGEYHETEAKGIKRILDTYFTLPWEKAKDFPDQQPDIFLYINLGAYDITQTLTLEKEFKEQYNIDVAKFPLTGDKEKDANARFNRLQYVVGQHQLELRKKQQKKETYSSQDTDFLQNSDVQGLFQVAVDGVNHYFRDIVTNPDGSIPGNQNPLSNRDQLEVEVLAEVQVARYKAFSTLTDHELRDINTCSQAIRNHLGIDNPPLSI